MGRESASAVGRASERFRVIAPLGSGSFGVVYEAEDLRSGQHVAIKELDELSAGSLSQFKREFRALADCHHPNLVGLRELIQEEGRWLIVMELVPGEDFLRYVRGDVEPGDGTRMQCDEERLRTALLGMAEGLCALHDYGVLHRDLKPGNVRVTKEGRAVLLDFGLVTRIDPREQTVTTLVGTAAYMAPEQAHQASLGPPADWYAYGVCLFEALTGQKPFAAVTPFQLLLDKQSAPAPLPSSRVTGVPRELDELCAGLLERDPERRFGPGEVLRALRGVAREDPSRLAALAPAAAPFGGRDRELAVLAEASARAQRGERAIVLVEGESGIGKSELVAEWVRRLRDEHPSLLALQGRCYEGEQVSYKAFDGCIDDLARYLRHLPDAECVALLPPRAAVLRQVFPVLRSVSTIARAPRSQISADPTARRLEAFAALCGLLSAVAESRLIVLVLDDLQWADLESFRLLAALVEYPGKLSLLVLATVRPREEQDEEVRAQLDVVRGLRETTLLALTPLPIAQARELAGRRLGAEVPPDRLAQIARESEGHPLFLSELVRFAQVRGLGETMTLGGALLARIEQLDEPARALLEMVALAGRPHGGHVFSAALDRPDVEEEARVLLASRLVRLRKGHELDVYHERIRDEVLGRIVPSRLSAMHRRLAQALARDPRADVSDQARHWDLAGDAEQAFEAYRKAARAAFDALAFAHAAQLFARARALLERTPRRYTLGIESDPRAQELLVQEADALACAARSAEAAALYERAARETRGAAQLRLWSRAAEQRMLSADLTRGLETARALLARVGVRLPAGGVAIVVRMLLDRLWLALPWRFVLRPKRPPRARDLLAFEVLDQLVGAVDVLHPSALFMLSAQQLRLAHRIGSPEAVCWANALLGWLLCTEGALKRALPRFERARALSVQLDDPRLTARMHYAEGAGRLVAGDFTEGIGYLERAHDLLQSSVPALPATLTNTRAQLGLAWYYLGAHPELARESARWLAEARERGDRRALALLTGLGHAFLRHVMQDVPEQALAELSEVREVFPPQPFSFVHFGYLIGMQMTLRYQGGLAALTWLEAHDRANGRTFLLHTKLGRRSLQVLRCLALLAAAVPAAGTDRSRVLAHAGRVARRLLRDRAPFARGYAHLTFAQRYAIEGDVPRALTHVQAAAEIARTHRLALASSVSYLRGHLEGGAAGGERRERALAQLRELGWRAPLKAVCMDLPALPLLSAEARGALGMLDA